jgi:hypothetical protein
MNVVVDADQAKVVETLTQRSLHLGRLESAESSRSDPKRATRLSVPSIDLISSRLTRPCSGSAGSFRDDSPVDETGRV